MFDSGATVNSTGVQGPAQTVLDTASDQSGQDLGEAWEYYAFTVATINPRTMNTDDPTAPGQTNQTVEELAQDCDTSNDAGADFYGTVLREGDQVSVPANGKNGVDWTLTYFQQFRGQLLTVAGTRVPEGDGRAVSPRDLGLGVGRGLVGSAWVGDSNLIKAGPGSPVRVTGVNQTDPAASNPALRSANGYYVTFFAYVSPDVTSLFATTGGSGTYGAEQCGDNDEGIHNGWDCDAANWNLNANGTPLPNQQTLAAVGQPYNFRDVDCYDGSVGGVVAAQLLVDSDEPCLRPTA